MHLLLVFPVHLLIPLHLLLDLDLSSLLVHHFSVLKLPLLTIRVKHRVVVHWKLFLVHLHLVDIVVVLVNHLFIG